MCPPAVSVNGCPLSVLVAGRPLYKYRSDDTSHRSSFHSHSSHCSLDHTPSKILRPNQYAFFNPIPNLLGNPRRAIASNRDGRLRTCRREAHLRPPQRNFRRKWWLRQQLRKQLRWWVQWILRERVREQQQWFVLFPRTLPTIQHGADLSFLTLQADFFAPLL